MKTGFSRTVPSHILAFSALFFAWSLPLRAEDPGAAQQSHVVGRPAAVVNNDPIFQSELDQEAEPFLDRYKKTAPEEEQTREKFASLKQEVLDRLIEEKLLLQEAKRKQLRVTKAEVERGMEQFKEPFSAGPDGQPRGPKDIEEEFHKQLEKEGLTLEQLRDRVEEQIMKVRLIETEVKAKVQMPPDDQVRKFFDKIRQKIAGQPVQSANKEEENDLIQISKYLERMTGEQYRLRHILIRSPKTDPVQKRAEARKSLEGIAQKINGGEDFAFMAKKHSEDPISAARGGDLGFVALGDLGLPEIDAVLKKLGEGRMSGVIGTEIGFHLIKLVEKKAPHPLEYEEVKDDLKNYIAQKTFTQRLEAYLKGLRGKASIKINPID